MEVIVAKYGVINKETSKTEYWYSYHRQKSLSSPWNDSKYVQYEIAEGKDGGAYSWDGSAVVLDEAWVDPNIQTQKQIDFNKYKKRASVKDDIIATMASNNMERVRNGVWTVAELIGLTQDVELKSILDDVSTLSYELAVGKIQSATNPLLTAEIKNEWITMLVGHFYN